MDQNTVIMKFGGASLSEPVSVDKVIGHIQDQIEKRPVLVFSAIGKTTRTLLHSALQAAEGRREYEHMIRGLFQWHEEMASGLLNGRLSGITRTLYSCEQELLLALDGVPRHLPLPARMQDRILVFGEIMSTAVMEEVLKARGIAAVLMDSREMILTDNRHTCARPLIEKSYSRIRSLLGPVLEAGKVPVIQGFIGSTPEGHATTLGFEGSDYTATLVGAALRAREIQIWKAVPGVMSADPDWVEDAHVLERISFREAAALSFHGARVLHPSTIGPAQQAGIPIGVYDVHRSGLSGTRIQPEEEGAEPCVKFVTSRDSLVKVTLSGVNGESPERMGGSFQAELEKYRIRPVAFFEGDGCVIAAVDAGEIMEGQIRNPGALGGSTITPGFASVTLLGNRLDTLPLHKQVLHALEGIPLECVAQSSDPTVFTILLAESYAEKAVQRLHHFFFPREKSGRLNNTNWGERP